MLYVWFELSVQKSQCEFCVFQSVRNDRSLPYTPSAVCLVGIRLFYQGAGSPAGISRHMRFVFMHASLACCFAGQDKTERKQKEEKPKQLKTNQQTSQSTLKQNTDLRRADKPHEPKEGVVALFLFALRGVWWHRPPCIKRGVVA